MIYSKKIEEYEKLKAQNENLKKIIAKELSENDELGSEFVYVNLLKEQVKDYEQALCYSVNLAREVLKKWGSV